MTGTMRAGLGLCVFFYLVWAVAVLILNQVDPQSLINSRGWHPLLPIYMSQLQDVPVLLPFLLATLLSLALAWVAIELPIDRRTFNGGIALLVCAAFAFVWWGSHAVYLDFALSMDEYYAEYQALIYANGAATVPVPAQWSDYRSAFFHPFLRSIDGGAQWLSMYLPVHSLLRAPLVLLGAPEILNALAVAGSIYLVADIARRIYPDDLFAPLAAALILAGSAQLMVVGMTAFAHTMHLFLNLLWLSLYLSPRRWAFAILPWVGVLALGLHQVHYHLFFAFPFFAHMVLVGRWRWLFYLCPVYGVAFLGFSNWQSIVALLVAGGGNVDVTDWATTHVRSAATIVETTSSWVYNGLAGPVNVFRFVAWQHIILLPLIVIALVHWKRLPTVVKLLAIGCAITLVARLIVTPNGGHQWGYRYFHNLLGNAALLAVAGLVILRAQLPDRWPSRLARMLGWSTVFSLFVLLPIRAVQVHDFVRPFAEASAYLQSLPNDIVIVDTASIWIGQDLVRNDPWLRNRPLLLNKQKLTADQRATLMREQSAVEVGIAELQRFGLMPYNGGRE